MVRNDLPDFRAAKDLGYKRFRRRHIYLHRLAGEDVLNPVEKQRRPPIVIVFRFLVYAVIAAFVIKERSQIEIVSEVNEGIRSGLAEHSFQYFPEPRNFYDISTVPDVKLWLDWLISLLAESGKGTHGAQNLSNPLSLSTYNRILPTTGVCRDRAAIAFTTRRMKLSREAEVTTTTRFRPFFPQTWAARTILPGEAQTEFEYTDPLNLWEDTVWKHTPACRECTGATGLAYRSAGGYLAVLTVGGDELLVHLVDATTGDQNRSNTSHDNSSSLCGSGLKTSGTISLEDFAAVDLSESASIVLEFQVYNANFQSLTKVSVLLDLSAAGSLSSSQIQTQTILLDVSSTYIRFFEYFYLVFSVLYFFELCYRIYKEFPQYLFNFWCYINGCSIFGSVLCFSVWYDYQNKLQDAIASPAFENPATFDALHDLFVVYTTASSIVTFTIFLRLLQFLAQTKSRVLMLLRTVVFSGRNMILYMGYIFIIFVGFCTFAMTHFGAISDQFSKPLVSFVSTFFLFMGDLRVMDGFSTSLKAPFMWLFLFFFFFLSVQMFSAIVNYSYNRTCEDLQVLFERDRQEQERRKRKQIQNHEQSLLHSCLGMCFKKSKRTPLEQDELSKEGFEQTAVLVAEEQTSETATKEDLRVKEKVKEYQDRVKNQISNDGACTFVMTMLAIFCYIWFMQANLLVEYKGQLRESLTSSVQRIEVPRNRNSVQPDASSDTLTWNEIQSLSEVVTWISTGLPSLVFNSTSKSNAEVSLTSRMRTDDVLCIKSWNCIMSGTKSAAAGRKVMRITQRRSKAVPNTGAAKENTPENVRFTGGMDNATGLPISQLIVATSGYSVTIQPDFASNVAEDTNVSFRLAYENGEGNLIDFCNYVKADPVNGGSYAKNGGIVCLLEHDYAVFQEQMSIMLNNGFFGTTSAAFIIELAIHNANRDMLTYMKLQFVMTPTGRIQKKVWVQSAALFGLDRGSDNWEDISLRLLPGVVFMIAMVYFTVLLCREFKLYRERFFNDGSKKRRFWESIYRFFASDIFRQLDFFALITAYASFAAYVMWLAKEEQILSMYQGDYSALLDYVGDLVDSEKQYCRLASIALLFVCCRPLRFMRSGPRMQMLNRLLQGARPDMIWFIAVLGIILFACTLLAHVSFGPSFRPCNSVEGAFLWCAKFFLGELEFWRIYDANPSIAILFFFPYVLFVYCVFQNIFFAILDRFYISSEPPPLNIKSKLKPIFSKVCRCIDWQEDFVMEEDPDRAKTNGPMSRASRVTVTAKIIQEIREKSIAADESRGLTRGLDLSEVCEVNERMKLAMSWGQEEAKLLQQTFQRLLQEKEMAGGSEDIFIVQEVMTKVSEMSATAKREAEDAFREMKYATEVHEIMALRDQQTLAKYILRLEDQIKKKMIEKHGNQMEVLHLQTELDNMRYTKEDLRLLNAVQKEDPGQSTIENDVSSEDESEQDKLPVEVQPQVLGTQDPNSVPDADVLHIADSILTNALLTELGELGSSEDAVTFYPRTGSVYGSMQI